MNAKISEKIYKNPFWFTVYRAVKQTFALPLMGSIVFFAGLVMSFDYYSYVSRDIEEIGLLALREKGTYAFFYYGDYLSDGCSMFNIGCMVGWAVISAVLGIFLFSFVTSKKKVNVYYSLGITRKSLYSARYLAGVFQLIIAATLPLFIMTLINIYYFGSSVILWRMFFFYALHFSVLAVVPFTVAAAICSCSGTVAEATAFTTILLASPTIISQCLKSVVPYILFGAPRAFSGMSVYGGGRVTLGVNSGFFNSIAANLNFLMLNYDEAFSVGCVTTKEQLNRWAMPSAAAYIIWLTFAALFFVFGLWMFKRRKAENCGFAGRNRVLNLIITTALSLDIVVFLWFVKYEMNGYAVGVANISLSERLLIIILGIAVSFAVYSLTTVCQLRKKKEIAAELKYSAIPISTAFIFTIVMFSGFFGYSTRIPDAEDIESVSVSAPTLIVGGSADISPTTYTYIDTDQNGDASIKVRSLKNNQVLIDGFKSKRDIEKIRELHRQLVYRWDTDRSQGFNIIIRYKLKNGSEITRAYYDQPIEFLYKTLELDDTDRWNEIVKRDAEKSNDTLYPVIYSAQMTRKAFVDRELVKGLIQAMAKDIEALDFNSFWNSGSKWLGSVNIFDARDLYDDYRYDGNIHDIENLYESEIRRIIREKYMADEYAGAIIDTIASGCSIFPITEEMTNTISFLKEHSLYEALSDTTATVKAKIFSIDDDYNYYYYDNLPIAYSYWIKSSDSQSIKAVSEITDEEALTKLQENAYGVYIAPDSNGKNSNRLYGVEFIHEDGSSTVMFVPKDKVNINTGNK